MVGRLVQQQNIRLFQQQPGQIHPGLFATGKAIKRLCSLISRNAQTIADFIHFHIHFVAATGLETVGKGVVLPKLLLGGTIGHLQLQLFHLPLGCHNGGIGAAKHILHGITFRKTGNLRN